MLGDERDHGRHQEGEVLQAIVEGLERIAVTIPEPSP